MREIWDERRRNIVFKVEKIKELYSFLLQVVKYGTDGWYMYYKHRLHRLLISFHRVGYEGLNRPGTTCYVFTIGF